MTPRVETVITGLDGKPKGGNPFQNTGAWLDDRTGCLTASRIAIALQTKKDGKPTKAYWDLAKEILAERMTGEVMRRYVTPEMQRGTEREPDAREAYEVHTGNLVRLVGFIKHPTIEMCGASPDGLVDDDGLVEFKCPTTTTHLEYLMHGKVPDDYKPQMTLQLACTRRSWCDFVSFDDRLKTREHRLFVVRFEPSADEIAAIEATARAYLNLVDQMWEELHTAKEQ